MSDNGILRKVDCRKMETFFTKMCSNENAIYKLKSEHASWALEKFGTCDILLRKGVTQKSKQTFSKYIKIWQETSQYGLSPKILYFSEFNSEIIMENFGIALGDWLERNAIYTYKFYAFMNVFEACRRLDKLNILHGDLHCNNILIDPDTLKVKIIDWDYAKKIVSPNYQIFISNIDAIKKEINKETNDKYKSVLECIST